MRQIIFFFIKNKNFLLFALLFTISIVLTVQSHSYHKSKFVSSSNFISGGLYSFKTSVTEYFNLKENNAILIEENTRLRKEINQLRDVSSSSEKDNNSSNFQFEYVNASVINNNYSKTKNEITIKKQPNTTVKVDQGVITSKGVIGIINDVSKNYATVQSILNTKSEINAKLKNSGHFGSLKWDTKNPNIVQLEEIPRIAKIAIGDTIVTSGKSTIFPENILIGSVKDFTLTDQDSYLISVDLFNDMTSLKHVYIVTNKDAEVIKALESHSDVSE
ncbi:rod shape-determining protein MreC [Patiriisocius hiemis]|uniref:Cell shape-determining protein MreC n=1 Tax=Patiriisocius hiemis TaxID=3075604 RepID=A0ABU2YDK1_9FLAO|nr:rod shape-determining protein MreC [Constantimarinum sp. W242]MDT0556251.1 rod shape-determining protein MreC [Constantimarinum sp. W242]